MLRAKEDGFFISAFDFDAVRFNIWIVFESLMNDAPIESAERFKFNDVAPTADFFGGILGFFHERFSGLGAVTADVHHNFRSRGVLLKQKAIGNILEVGKSLALAAYQAAGIVGFDVEQNAFFHMMLLDGD